MDADLYQELLSRAQAELPPDQMLRLGEELVRHAARRNGPRRLAELEGLGQEIWQSIDVDDYLRQERDAWNG